MWQRELRVRWTTVVVVLAGCWAALETRAAPVTVTTLMPSGGVPPISALKFMQRFGYLEQGTPDSEALYSEQSLSEAVRVVQKFGALPQTGVLDNATLQLMDSKRCGVPDVVRHHEGRQKRYIIGSEGWRKRDLTFFVANWSPKVGEQAAVEGIQKALDAWSGYARIKFRPVRDPNADIIVAFGSGPHGDGYPFDGPGGVLAHAYYPYEMGSYGGDIHFDNDEKWTTEPEKVEDGVDFFTVAVHELGHSLGLSHSPISSSIMFPYYKGYQPNLQLDYDDILAMYELYISRRLEGDDEVTDSQDTTDDDSRVRGGHDRDDESTSTSQPPPAGPTLGGHDRDDEDTSTSQSPVAAPTTEAGVTYEGDVESVDEHIKHTRPEPPSLGDGCEGSYDAIAVLRGELFIFKGKYLWRLSRRGEVQPGYPVLFRQFFWKLPESVTKIDAAYQRQSDGNIVLFTGNKYWVFDGTDFIEGSPRPLTEYGLPQTLQKIDAALVWNKNGKTFLYSEDQYWRYNETTHQMDPGYPRNMSRWRGVPSNLDTAMTWTDGLTYFFKGKLFWRFDNMLIKTDERYPLPAPQNWLGCPETPNTIWW